MIDASAPHCGQQLLGKLFATCIGHRLDRDPRVLGAYLAEKVEMSVYDLWHVGSLAQTILSFDD